MTNAPDIHCRYDRMIPIHELKDHPKNRNKHSDEQIERLAKLYEYHGIRHPIIISELSGCIVAGHGRKLAGKKAGFDSMPVVFQKFADETAEYAFIQADNAIAAWSELDLAGINADLPDLGPDFDLEMLGLKDFTIDPSEVELPDLESEDPDCQQVTFILSNEQKDILDQAMEKASQTEDCTDGINQNKNGNTLAAILRSFLRG
jgi:hypothetical protein